MEIGIGQQRQKARAIDRHGQLTLVAGLSACDTRRDDLAVFVDEILQDPDVLVIDLLDALCREAAELSAPKELPPRTARVLPTALALTLVSRLGFSIPSHCHDVLPLKCSLS